MSDTLRSPKENNDECTILCKKLPEKPSSVKCNLLAWNVWSIANDEKLRNCLQIMDDRRISIACITETWFDRKTGTFSKTIKDAGYKIHHAFRE